MSYPFRIAVVSWDDAVSHSDGSGRPQHKPARQITIGWLLQFDDVGVSIAYEYGEDDQSWREEQFIPAPLVRLVEYLDLVD